MDLEAYAKQLRAGKNGEALQKLTESGAGAALAERFDGAAIEAAAQRGDTAALSEMLKKVLGTPEGRQFAQQVQKTVNGHGR